jgi:hypothetical protein
MEIKWKHSGVAKLVGCRKLLKRLEPPAGVEPATY